MYMAHLFIAKKSQLYDISACIVINIFFLTLTAHMIACPLPTPHTLQVVG